ncbi:craniofacial development protein 2-like [Plakobranchus ocellatus]|uniref:Craniofacial development protein 2-like n=1 Tax=Plakobranchus ocellatus TaxID=259542 RepID=A0AAV3XZK5_9GAST|nr:craniofacial development protein 2-like [Plakobranchus ocellatus]
MERMKLNILGLSEVRWKGAGKITSGGHEIIYSGGTESEKGVGIIVDQTVTKAIKGYWALSDRVLLVKIAGKPVDLNIIQVYAPKANSNDEDLDKFYNELDKRLNKEHPETFTFMPIDPDIPDSFQNST